MASKVYNERDRTRKVIFVEQKSDNGTVELPREKVDFGNSSKQLKNKRNFKLEVETDIGEEIDLDPGPKFEIKKEKEFERDDKLVHQYKMKQREPNEGDGDQNGDEDMSVKDPPLEDG